MDYRPQTDHATPTFFSIFGQRSLLGQETGLNPHWASCWLNAQTHKHRIETVATPTHKVYSPSLTDPDDSMTSYTREGVSECVNKAL